MTGDTKYYLNINDQNVGPLSFEEVADRVKNGLLNADDFIFVAGQKDWQIVKDLSEFSPYIAPEDPASRKIWFIRKNRQNAGPYSKKEILDMIESGGADINDYIWSKELRNWTSIKDTFMIGQEKPAEQKEDVTPIADIIKEPVPVQEKQATRTRVRALPEFTLGVALILLAFYQSGTSVLKAVLFMSIGIGLIVISFYESRNKKGEN